MQQITLCCLIYFFQDYMNQNITIYESFQIKNASPRIIVLMIMTTLMKVRRKGLSLAWLPFTFRYQNTSVQPLILLNFFFTSKNWRTQDNVTELVFNIPCLNLAHILQTRYPFVAADSHII